MPSGAYIHRDDVTLALSSLTMVASLMCALPQSTCTPPLSGFLVLGRLGVAPASGANARHKNWCVCCENVENHIFPSGAWLTSAKSAAPPRDRVLLC